MSMGLEALRYMDPPAEERAFAALVEVLGTDPTLSLLSITLVRWDGSAEDFNPPTPGMAPWIRLSPSSGQPRRLTIDGDTDCPMLVEVETCLDDLSASARFRFWDVVRRAVLGSQADMPRLAEVGRIFGDAGVRDVEIARNGYGIDSATEGGLVVSKGQFLLSLTVDS